MELLSSLGGWGSTAPTVAPTVAPQSQAQPQPQSTSAQPPEPSVPPKAVIVVPPLEIPASAESRAIIVQVGTLFDDISGRIAAEQAEERRIKTEVVGPQVLARRDQEMEDAVEKFGKQIGARVVENLRQNINGRLNDETARIKRESRTLQDMVEAGVTCQDPAQRAHTIQRFTSPPLRFETSVVVTLSDVAKMPQIEKVQTLIARYGNNTDAHHQGLIAATKKKLDDEIQAVARRVVLALQQVFSNAVDEFDEYGALTWDILDAEIGGLALGKTWDREQAALEAQSKWHKRTGADRQHWVLRKIAAGAEAYHEDAKVEYTNEASYKEAVQTPIGPKGRLKISRNQTIPRELREEGREIRVKAVLTVNRQPVMDLIDAVYPPPEQELDTPRGSMRLDRDFGRAAHNLGSKKKAVLTVNRQPAIDLVDAVYPQPEQEPDRSRGWMGPDRDFERSTHYLGGLK